MGKLCALNSCDFIDYFVVAEERKQLEVCEEGNAVMLLTSPWHWFNQIFYDMGCHEFSVLMVLNFKIYARKSHGNGLGNENNA